MKILSADSHIEMGAIHDLCEDYAIAKDNILVVCDGCSSSPDTDFGAQALARAAYRNIQMCAHTVPGIQSAMESAIYTAQGAAKVLNLPDESLDATLVVAVADDDQVHFFFAGDGFCAWKNKKEEPWYLQVEYDCGAPEYLSYKLNPNRYDAYKKEFGNDRTLVIDSEQSKEDKNVIIHCMRHRIKEPIFNFSIDVKDLEYVCIFSDGVGSFQGRSNGEILNNLTSFKNFKGKFMTRRAKRYLKTQGIRHEDDLACAAMSFTDEE